MVVMALLSLFSVFLVSLIKLSNNTWSIGSVTTSVQNNSKRIVESMIQELREADPSAPPPTGFTEPITISADFRTITFVAPNDVDEDGPVDWNTIQYTLNVGTQQISRSFTPPLSVTPTTTILARNVEALQFAKSVTDNEITISLTTLGLTKAGQTIRSPLTSKVTVRN